MYGIYAKISHVHGQPILNEFGNTLPKVGEVIAT